MKLNVLIPTRGRPYQLAAAIYSLYLCASGDHEVKFCVACDDDDEASKNAIAEMRRTIPIFVRVGPRPESLGSVANDLAAHWPADAYAVWADDLACCTYGWDQNVAKAVEKTPHGVFWWTAARDVATFVPVVTEKWRAAAGAIFTDHFPFWYDDLWLQELWIMTTDGDPISLDCKVIDKPQATQRMRELRFWHDFYRVMRPERVRRGKEIAAALGLPEPRIGAHLAPRLDAMSEVTNEFLEDIQVKNKAETGEPSATYLKVRARAEQLMREAA